MCRLLGMTAGRERVRATFWLVEDSDSLDRQSHENPDGAGIGSFAPDGTPVLDKQPLAAYEDRAFLAAAQERASTTFVAHVRHSTGSAKTVANTHPFVLDGRVFAHNGEVGDLPLLESELGEAMGLVGGDTDSERIFALITRAVRGGRSVEEAIVESVGWLARNVPVGAVNLVLATPTDLWALRYPETHELWVVERPADGGAANHRSSEGTRIRSDDLGSAPSVLVASERLDAGEDWRLVEPGTLLHVGPDLVVHETATGIEPPRRRVTLG